MTEGVHSILNLPENSANCGQTWSCAKENILTFLILLSECRKNVRNTLSFYYLETAPGIRKDFAYPLKTT